MTNYLTVVEVLVIHADQIDRCGGAQGMRDRGLLEVADLG
jgi:death-on-curing protein